MFHNVKEVVGGACVIIIVMIFGMLVLFSAAFSVIVISEALINYIGLGDSFVGKIFIYGLASFVGFIPFIGQALGAIIAYSVFDWSGLKIMIVFFSVALCIPSFISFSLMSLGFESIFKKNSDAELSDDEKQEKRKKTILGKIKKTGKNIFMIIFAISALNAVFNSVYAIYPFVMHFADFSDSFITNAFTFLVAFIIGIIPFIGQAVGAIFVYVFWDATISQLLISFFSPFLLIFLALFWIFTVSVLKAVFK